MLFDIIYTTHKKINYHHNISLTDEDMTKIAGLEKSTSIFQRQPGMMDNFAKWVPDVDGQK